MNIEFNDYKFISKFNEGKNFQSYKNKIQLCNCLKMNM